MKKGEDLGGFFIVCKDCQSTGKEHETMLYVDWDNGLYTIQCKTCNRAVYFDFYGRQIPAGMIGTILGGRKKELN